MAPSMESNTSRREVNDRRLSSVPRTSALGSRSSMPYILGTEAIPPPPKKRKVMMKFLAIGSFECFLFVIILGNVHLLDVKALDLMFCVGVIVHR